MPRLRPFLLPALWIALILATLRWADRPLATWLHQHPDSHGLFRGLTRLADLPAPLACLALILLAWRRPAPLAPRWRAVLAAALATLIALAFKEQLKYLCGRTWPETWIEHNPSWIANGVFTFSPLHGGRGWSSFPSGHATAISAPMAALWRAAPRWRLVWPLPVLLVCIGLLGADYHWLSDIEAGLGLGLLTARLTWRFLFPAPLPVSIAKDQG